MSVQFDQSVSLMKSNLKILHRFPFEVLNTIVS